jgi:hypothetical protein
MYLIMKNQVRKIGSEIAQAIEVLGNKQLLLYGRPYDAYQRVRLPEGFSISWPIFKKGLEELLYMEFYAKDPDAILPQKADADLAEADRFLTQLQEANHSTEGPDKGWVAETFTQTGEAVINKGGYRRLAAPGEYLRAQEGESDQKGGAPVWLYRKREYAGEMNGFYFVFGDTLLEQNPAQWVRLYFNLEAEGAPLVIEWLTKKLNHYQIPFTFKCLRRPVDYYRTDAGVLYIEKRYFNLFYSFLPSLLEQLAPCLNPNTPLFTRALFPGVGFSENPFDQKESFGTSRCKMIVEGIVKALQVGAPKEAWVEFIEGVFAEQGIDPERPYLGPGSHFPYAFDRQKAAV